MKKRSKDINKKGPVLWGGYAAVIEKENAANVVIFWYNHI